MPDQAGKKKTGQNASTLAAGSLANYFQQKRWEIISFFPNGTCKKDEKDFPGTKGNK